MAAEEVEPARPDRIDVATPKPLGPRHRRRPTIPWRTPAELLAHGVLATAVTAVVFRVWSIPLRVPFDYQGDGLTQASVVKGIAETGWYTVNDRLGAPTGFNTLDFPLGGENLHYAGIKVLTWFSKDPFLVLNVAWLASFVTVSLSAYLALRLLAVRPWFAHAAALVFAFLPYHLLRGTAHLTLGNYVSVPFACLLVAATACGSLPRIGQTRTRSWWWRVAAVVGAGALVASAGGYYAVFTLALTAMAVLVAFATVGWRAALSGVAAAAVVVVVLAANSFPSLRYQSENGHNPAAAPRQVWEVDWWPLRPVQLVTPVPGHRVAALDDLGRELRRAPSNSEPTQPLGLVGSFGLAVVLVRLFAGGAARPGTRLGAVHPGLGLVVGGSLLMGVWGGFAWFTSLAGLQDVRAWGRISVFIGFAALAGLAQWLQASTRRWPAGAVGALAAVVAALAFFDQVPRALVPDPSVNELAVASDRRFVQAVEAALPTGAMVFQLPRAAYPEDPVQHRMAADNQLRPYLLSEDLRWSFGGMRGRESDWQVASAAQPVPEFLDSIAAVGFDGVLVDRFGYGDGGTAIERELGAALGPPLVVSDDARLAFYDLRAFRAALPARLGGTGAVEARARRELLRPTMWWETGFFFEERTPDGLTRPASASARSRVVNCAEQPWRGTVRFRLVSESRQPGTVTVALPGAPARTVAVGPEPVEVAVEVVIPPGRTAAAWVSDAPGTGSGDPRDVRFRVVDLAFVDAGASPDAPLR